MLLNHLEIYYHKQIIRQRDSIQNGRKLLGKYISDRALASTICKGIKTKQQSNNTSNKFVNEMRREFSRDSH